MIDLTALTPLQLMLALALIFLAAVGANHICHALLVGAKSLRRIEPPAESQPEPAPQMTVIPPWSEPVEDPEPIPPAWRQQLALEPAPMCPPLAKADSREWRFTPFRPTRHVADLAPTGEWKVVGGVDPLDVEEPEPPKQMPGFEVGEARGRFIKDPTVAAAAKLLPKKRGKRPVTVDLGEMGTRTVEVSA